MNTNSEMVLQIKKISITAILFISSLYYPAEKVLSQTLLQKYDGINFSVNGNNSSAPFNGGQNNARFQLVDIDGDNDLDLFTFDVDTTLYFYQNTGTPQSASFKLITANFQNLNFKNWFYFTDIDNDNDYDMFTGGDIQTIKFFRNTGNSSSPSLTLEISELRTNTDTVIYSESNSVPVFCDIDGDGDKDFFTGQSLGTITYYQNIGSTLNFSFKFITDFWQNLLIISPAFDNERHGANSLEFTDIDADNDYDLFWGDLFSKGIYFIKNIGTQYAPSVEIVDSIYPHNSPYISLGYNSTRFADIDADGDKDLFVSVLYPSQNKNNFAFYINNGTASLADFQRISINYLNNVDAGGSSNIVLTDIDNDEDKDLICGNDVPAKLTLYLNTGTAVNPQFVLETDSLPIRTSAFNFTFAPAFADLDADGDKDLFLGSYIKDSIWFYRNTGTPENFVFTYSGTGRMNGIDSTGQSTTPAFADIDNDNDQDLFIGASNGRIFYYENTGTPQNFIFTFRTAYYNSIDAGDDAVPRFTDIDGDQDFDLFIGKQSGMISYYKNEGTVYVPNFVLQTTEYKNIYNMQNTCPEFADIDNDTDKDLFIGNVKGGIYYFQNEEISGISGNETSLPSKFRLFQNYPNPFNPSTSVKYELFKSGFIRLKIYNVLGAEVKTLVSEYQNAGVYSVTFNTDNFNDNLSGGIYFCSLFSDNYSETIKMILIR